MQISSRGQHLLQSFPTAGEAKGSLFIALLYWSQNSCTLRAKPCFTFTNPAQKLNKRNNTAMAEKGLKQNFHTADLCPTKLVPVLTEAEVRRANQFCPASVFEIRKCKTNTIVSHNLKIKKKQFFVVANTEKYSFSLHLREQLPKLKSKPWIYLGIFLPQNSFS